jgi:N-acetylneuraminic acid mutarotase
MKFNQMKKEFFSTLKLLALLLFNTVLARMPFAQTSFSWNQKATCPHDLQNIDAEPRISFSLNGYGYWGGSGDILSLWRYDPKKDQWSKNKNLPLPSSGIRAFTINEKAYYMPTSNGQVLVYEYQENSDNWIQVAVFPGTDRVSSFVFIIGHKAYILMGRDAGGNHLSDVWEFDAIEYKFTQKSNFPFSPRWGGAAFAINGKGYIGMGNLNWNFEDPNGKELYEYTPSTDSWIQKASLPVLRGRYAVESFSVSNFGFIIGGESNWPTIFYNEFWRYDPKTNSWNQLPGYSGGFNNYLKSFVIGDTCYVGKKFLWNFSSPNSILSSTDLVNNDLFSIYPNPANNYITIFNGDFIAKSNYRLSIQNILGQQIFQSILNQKELNIETDTWGGSGIYFVNITDKDGVIMFNKKVVIKH